MSADGDANPAWDVVVAWRAGRTPPPTREFITIAGWAGEGVRTGSGGGHDAGRRLVQGGQVQLTAADGGSVAGEEGLQAGDPPWPGLRDGLVWANQPDSGTPND